MKNKLPKLILGYDIMFPYQEVPNALNPKYLAFAKDCDWKYDLSDSYFIQNFNKPWSVFNGRFLVDLDDESGHPGYFAIDKKSVYDIIKDRERGKEPYNWYYLIEPYGCIDNFFGLTAEYKEEYFHNYIPKDTLNEIKNHNGYLVINYAIDGGFNFTNLKQLKISLDILNIPFEKVIIIHNDINLENNMCDIFHNEIPKLIHYCWSLNSKSKEYYNRIQNPNYNFWNQDDRKKDYNYMSIYDVVNFDKKQYKFLNLNRRLRKHRIDIIKFLKEENILENTLISYDKALLTEDSMVYTISHYGINDWNNFYNFLEQTSPKIVDYDNIENIWGYGFESKTAYQNSLISILSETFFYEETGYLSEKIWKPIAHGHPFILVGPAGSLKYIKEKFGFKTFSPYIDESYDDEPDCKKRMELIQNEIKRLNNYSLEELKEMVLSLKDIILYNKNLILAYGSKNICLDYLHYLRISNKESEANELLENLINKNKNINQLIKPNLI